MNVQIETPLRTSPYEDKLVRTDEEIVATLSLQFPDISPITYKEAIREIFPSIAAGGLMLDLLSRNLGHDSQPMWTSIEGIQHGLFGIHVAFDLEYPDGGAEHVVSYISRGPEYHQLGLQADNDFVGLTWARKDLHRRPDVLNQIDVVEPLLYSYWERRGLRYPVYFTRRDYQRGELFGHTVWVDGMPVPVLRYAQAYTREFDEVNKAQAQLRFNLMGHHGDNVRDASFSVAQHQWFDVARSVAMLGCAISNLPRNIEVNAGDIMGVLSHEQVSQLMLVSVKKGMRPVDCVEDIVEVIQSYKTIEIDPTDAFVEYQTFRLLSHEDLFTAVREAHEIVGS